MDAMVQASELVRDSLRLLEERDIKLEMPRTALIEGEESDTAGKLDIESIKRKGREKARKAAAK